MERKPTAETEPKKLQSYEFIGGMIHQLATRNGGKYTFNVHDRRLHGAFKDTFDYLKARTETDDVELEFTIQPDRIHGDSQVVSDELMFLMSVGMLRGYNGSFSRLIYDTENPAAQLYETIPGISSDLTGELVRVFESSFWER